jgi:2-dehydro-3-deoxygalactonokinase
MPAQKPADMHILGDWGTSRLRLYLMDGDEIVDRCDGPGVATFGTVTRTGADTITSALVSSLLEQTAAWRQATRSSDVLLAGMAGSRNGVVEVPYASTPTHREDWARAAWTKQLPDIRLTIATGLRHCIGDQVDVMRGEETQVFGAMHLYPQLMRGSQVFVLPGTHSKWVDVQDGTIIRFTTAMTGEVFALLRDHSTLLRVGDSTADVDAEVEAGFDDGAMRSENLTEGLLAALFRTRAAQLLEQRSKSWARGFLSGLLIGCEIASLSRSYPAMGSVCVVGEGALAKLYRRVLDRRGVSATTENGATCVVAGLLALRNAMQIPTQRFG